MEVLLAVVDLKTFGELQLEYSLHTASLNHVPSDVSYPPRNPCIIEVGSIGIGSRGVQTCEEIRELRVKILDNTFGSWQEEQGIVVAIEHPAKVSVPHMFKC